MIVLWTVMWVAGLALVSWAYVALPKGTDMMPIPPRGKLTKAGPYRWRWLKHPMYVGNVAFVAGLAGMTGGRAGGLWAALAVGFLAKMLMQYWAGLESR